MKWNMELKLSVTHGDYDHLWIESMLDFYEIEVCSPHTKGGDEWKMEGRVSWVTFHKWCGFYKRNCNVSCPSSFMGMETT